MSTKLTLEASEEQVAAIKALYEENGWTFPESPAESSETLSNEASCEWRTVSTPKPCGHKCEHCLQDPCITHEDNRQQWWPNETSPARDGNNQGRKKLYKLFWSMLSNRGLWMEDIYLARKDEALQRDPNRKKYLWSSGNIAKRDLMPNCVLKLVRGWLPNPVKKEYMGHMWE